MSASLPGRSRNGKKRILVFCDYYHPSTKGGGGLWTVANLIDRFNDRYDFLVVTRNHESRTDLRPYKTVKTGAWNTVGQAQVHYLAPNKITTRTIAALIGEVAPDGIYLNSLFSKPVIKFLLLRRLNGYKHIPVVLAPCGELSPGALGLKRTKKRSFLAMAKALRLYSNVNWKASSDLENAEIQNVFGKGISSHVASDLPPRKILPGFDFSDKPEKSPGRARFIFLSRIDRKKNLLFALRSLSRAVKMDAVEFRIVGPIEDERYWSECKALIDKMPSPITVKTVQGVSNEIGLKHLMDSHFLVLPTLGENFGYVVLEALSAGCPVLLSDRTIWSSVETKNAGWLIPLEKLETWDDAITRCIEMGPDEFHTMSSNARAVAVEWLSSPDSERSNLKVLAEVIGE